MVRSSQIEARVGRSSQACHSWRMVVFPDQPLLLYETALKADNPVLAVKTALDSVCAVRSHINRIYGKAGLRGIVRRCATP